MIQVSDKTLLAKLRDDLSANSDIQGGLPVRTPLKKKKPGNLSDLMMILNRFHYFPGFFRARSFGEMQTLNYQTISSVFMQRFSSEQCLLHSG